MRKFSKILAVLLSLAMLLGVTVSLIGATNESVRHNLIVDAEGVKTQNTNAGLYNIFSDFEDGNTITGSGNAFSSNAAVSVVSNAAGTNKYLQARLAEKLATKEGNAAYLFFYGQSKADNAVADGYGFVNHDFMVLDFEFCADSYRDNITGELTDSATDAEGNANTLAYPMAEDGKYALAIKILSRIGGSGSWMMDKQLGVYPPNQNTNGAWYLSWNGASTLTNNTLSTVAGEWNHLTVIFEIANTFTYYTGENYTGDTLVGDYNADIVSKINGGDLSGEYKSYKVNFSESKLHFFLNGVHMGTDSSSFPTPDADSDTFWKSNSIEKFDFLELRNQVANTGFTGNTFSFAFDNTVAHYYKNGYAGELKDYLAGDKSANLSTINDVVYNGLYDIPGTEKNSAVIYEDVDESEFVVLEKVKGYDIANGAFIELLAEQYVEIFESFENYTPKKAFYIKWDAEKVNFSLADNCGYQISAEPNEAGYYFVSKIPGSELINVTWIYDIEEGDVETLEVGKGGALVRETAGLTLVEGKEYTYRVFKSWQYTTDEDVENEEVWLTLEQETLDGELYETLYNEGLNLYIRPVYEEQRAAYAIVDASGNITEPKFDVDTFDDDVKAGKRVMLTSDLKATSTSASGGKYYIAIANNVTAYIDLNGFTLDLSGLNYSQGAFTIGQNAKLNIYSSKIGGKVTTPYGLARSNNSTGATLIIGKAGDVAGENAKVNLYVGYIMTAQGITNNWRSLKVYGANITKNATADNSALFKGNQRTDNTVFDSCLIMTSVPIMGGSATATAGYNENVKFIDCVIIAKDAEGNPINVFGNVGNYSGAEKPTSIVIDGGYVYGKLTPSDANSTKEFCATPITVIGGAYISTTEALPTAAISLRNGYKLNAIAKTVDLPVVDFESGAISTFPATFNYVEGFSAQANIKTNNGFYINVYVPTVLGATVSTTEGGAALSGVAYGEYTMYTVAANPTTVEVFEFYITFDGQTVKTAISLADYLNVLAGGAYGDAAKALAVNAANYCNELYKGANGVACEEYAGIVSENPSLIITPENLNSVQNIVSTDVISSAQFIIGEGNVPVLAFKKVSEAVVTVKYTDVYGNEQTVTCTVITEGGVEYYVVAEMPVYDMLADFSVYANDTLVLTYSIDDYIANTSDEIVTALYGYAQSVVNWKKS